MPEQKATSDSVKYWLSILEPPSKYNLLVELTPDEHATYLDAALRFQRLDHRFSFKLVSTNYRDVKNVHRFAGILLGLGRKFATPDRLTIAGAVMGQVVNWLTAVRLFLDHAQTDLTRRFKKTSGLRSRPSHVDGSLALFHALCAAPMPLRRPSIPS